MNAELAVIVLGVIAAFVVYRIWLGAQSERIVADSGAARNEEKRQEYESKDQALVEEIKNEQAAYDNSKHVPITEPPSKG
jgi:hypothetical protein